MSHTLTIEIPDHLFDTLCECAEQQGKQPEELSAEWIVAQIEHESNGATGKRATPKVELPEWVLNDPLMRLAGTFNSGVPDLAARHDYYLGKALERELTGEED